MVKTKNLSILFSLKSGGWEGRKDHHNSYKNCKLKAQKPTKQIELAIYYFFKVQRIFF